MQANLSEVTRIREQIELECQAFARMFEEPAIVASHRSINARYRRIDQLQEVLVCLVGAQEATKITFDVYEKTIG